VKLHDPSSLDVVDAHGGGLDTIQNDRPHRDAAIEMLKVGDMSTASVSSTFAEKGGLWAKAHSGTNRGSRKGVGL
jgi:hypothetical protein